MPRELYAVGQVKAMLAQGAQLVDVLPADDYEIDHLPGAVNIPLKGLDRKTTANLDRLRPVLVYCYDSA